MRTGLTTFERLIGRARSNMLWACSCVVMLGLVAVPPASGQESSDIEIVGGTIADQPNHFTWKVKNINAPRIISFRAPRHLATDTVPPPGWSSEMIEGSNARNGEVLFKVDSPVGGIRPGQTVEFQAQDRRRIREGRTSGAASVVVGFADGSKRVVSGVLCPVEESLFSKYISLIGLGAMFAVFLLVQAIRRSRSKTAGGENLG